MEKTKNAELVEEKEKKLCFKNLIIHGVEKSSSDNKDDVIKYHDIDIKNFIAALKVPSTVKTASRLGLSVQDKNRPNKVVVNTKVERNRILSNLRNLKGIPEYKNISVTEDYTVTERRMIKDWSDKAKEKNKNESPDSKFVWIECEVFEKRAATKEVPEVDQSRRLQLTHGNEVLKLIQDNQEADYDKNYKKSFNSDHITYPSSKSMFAINIMYANADQFIIMKNSELLEFVERKKPHIIANVK